MRTNWEGKKPFVSNCLQIVLRWFNAVDVKSGSVELSVSQPGVATKIQLKLVFYTNCFRWGEGCCLLGWYPYCQLHAQGLVLPAEAPIMDQYGWLAGLSWTRSENWSMGKRQKWREVFVMVFFVFLGCFSCSQLATEKPPGPPRNPPANLQRHRSVFPQLPR